MSGFGVVFVEVIGDLRASEGRKMSKRGREGRSLEASGHDPASRLKQNGFKVSSGKGMGGTSFYRHVQVVLLAPIIRDTA